MLHICHEAIAIFDPENYLQSIRRSYVKKSTYRTDIEIGLRILAALRIVNVESFDKRRRRRYFWGLRTSLMAGAAEMGRDAFSSSALQDLFEIAGLSSHIDQQICATFSDCQRVSKAVLSKLQHFVPGVDFDDDADNLVKLLGHGGVGGGMAADLVYNG